MFAVLEVDTGQVHTKFTEYKKREDFRSFLNGVLAAPTSASWLNQIEIVFSLLQRNTLNG